MTTLTIEVPDDEVRLLLDLLPKLGARVIYIISDEKTSPVFSSLIEPFVQFDGRYYYDDFESDAPRTEELNELFPNASTKNNRDVGGLSIEIVKDYLLAKFPESQVMKGSKGADLEFMLNGKSESIEVKGTTANHISWPTIKVSSQDCHDSLQNGMTLVRVINAHTSSPRLYFLKYNRDFTLRKEPRWSVHSVKQL